MAPNHVFLHEMGYARGQGYSFLVTPLTDRGRPRSCPEGIHTVWSGTGDKLKAKSTPGKGTVWRRKPPKVEGKKVKPLWAAQSLKASWKRKAFSQPQRANEM